MTVLTCILTLILTYNPSGEYVKSVPVLCEVMERGPTQDDIEQGYHHIKVDCRKGMSRYGVAKNKINISIRWVSSTDCYDLRGDEDG